MIISYCMIIKRAYGATHWCVLCRRHAFSFEKKSTVCCKKCYRTWSILTFEKFFWLKINAQLQWHACWLLRWVSSWLEWFEFWPSFLVELIAHFWERPNFSPLAPKCARGVDLQVVKIRVQLCAKVLCALGRFCAQRSARAHCVRKIYSFNVWIQWTGRGAHGHPHSRGLFFFLDFFQIYIRCFWH